MNLGLDRPALKRIFPMSGFWRWWLSWLPVSQPISQKKTLLERSLICNTKKNILTSNNDSKLKTKKLRNPAIKWKVAPAAYTSPEGQKLWKEPFGVLQVANLELGDCFSKFFYRYSLHHFSIILLCCDLVFLPVTCVSATWNFFTSPDLEEFDVHTHLLYGLPRKSMTCMFKCHSPTVSTTNLHMFRQHTSETS